MYEKLMKCSRGWYFVGGALTSLIVAVFVKSDCARKMTVNAVAKGLKVKDNVEYTFAAIKEDAEDVYQEARSKQSSGQEIVEEDSEV